jgi:hypothetical protein
MRVNASFRSNTLGFENRKSSCVEAMSWQAEIAAMDLTAEDQTSVALINDESMLTDQIEWYTPEQSFPSIGRNPVGKHSLCIALCQSCSVIRKPENDKRQEQYAQRCPDIM